MFLEDLSESGEVEGLVVLQQNEAEVELAEGQFEVVQLAHVSRARVLAVLEAVVDARLTPHAERAGVGPGDVLHVDIQIGLQARILPGRFG